MERSNIIDKTHRGAQIFEILLRGPVCSHQWNDLHDAHEYYKALVVRIPANPSAALDNFVQHFTDQLGAARIDALFCNLCTFNTESHQDVQDSEWDYLKAQDGDQQLGSLVKPNAMAAASHAPGTSKPCMADVAEIREYLDTLAYVLNIPDS